MIKELFNFILRCGIWFVLALTCTIIFMPELWDDMIREKHTVIVLAVCSVLYIVSNFYFTVKK